jgi:large subunit ribosomal protein L24
MKIKAKDKVRVMAGKDKGREGIVERVYQKMNKVSIPGINMFKKHVKKSEQAPQGGVVEVPRPLNIANVALLCPKCGKIARVGYEVNGNKKYRICKKCKSKI